MRNILSKIKEGNNKINIRNIHLKLKKFKTNNNYDKFFSSKKFFNNKNQLKLNLRKIKMNISAVNNSSIRDINKTEKPLDKITNLKLNLNIENTNSEKNYLPSPKYNKRINCFFKNLPNENKSEEENNNNNFFQTLPRVKNHQLNNNNKNKPKRIENLIQIMKIIRDEEEKFKILNRNIFNIKKISNSLNKIKKINMSINYSRIRNKKDNAFKILNDPKNHISEYSKKNMNFNLHKRILDINNKYLYKNNNSSINRKNSLVLPICP